MDEAMSWLVESFARQLLPKSSDMTASKDVLNDAKTPVEALDRIATNKRADVWAVPKSQCMCKRFHITFCTSHRCVTRVNGCLRSAEILQCHNAVRRSVDV